MGETYPDDRNVLDMVFEALRLIAGILLGHLVARTKFKETQSTTVLTTNWSGSV